MSLLPSANTCCDPCSGGTQTVVSIEDLIDEAVASRLGGVNVLDYGAVGDGTTDDSEAFQEAVQAAAGKTLTVPAGYTFIVGNINLPSNIHVTGGGTLKFANNTAASGLLAIESVDHVVIEGITFDGNIANQTTWSEHRHAVVAKDSSYWRVTGCVFQNLIGDGILVGRIDSASAPYIGCSHWIIDHNFMPGDSTNRNGVSVLCAEYGAIFNNDFTAMARSGMPGAIDLEPSNVDEFCHYIAIVSNRIGGHDLADLNEQTAISLNNVSQGSIKGIDVIGNNMVGNFFYPIYLNGHASSGTDSATVRGNTIRNSEYGTENLARAISSARFTNSIQGNTIDLFEGAAIWCDSGDLDISGNTILKAQRGGLVIGSLCTGQITNNRVHNAGFNGTNPSAAALYIEASGMLVADNHFTASGAAITIYGIYAPLGSNNFITGNFLGGIDTRNFNCANAQFWGINHVATAGSLADTVTHRNIVPFTEVPASNAVMIKHGNLVGHSCVKLLNGIVYFVNGLDSAFVPIQADAINGAAITSTTQISTPQLFVTALPSHANNAAALGGGLQQGQLYQVTGTDPRQVAVVV